MATKHLFKAHPWHGIPLGDDSPRVVTAYIEMVPTDTVKYEIDKETGHLKVDRPQQYSNFCPALYGFLPRTLCGEEVAQRARAVAKNDVVVGDGDPLDILVLTEKTLSHGDCLLRAIPIGGFRVIDGGEADDKIIATLVNDAVFGEIEELDACPKILIDRLSHYFLTYKLPPGAKSSSMEIAEQYNRKEAMEVILASCRDYLKIFPY
ncbi:MAG: inorganic pyrophosphatase [Myxococcales bacterium]|nr:inorganic pyrophosphatase [Myxococcales bacterium]